MNREERDRLLTKLKGRRMNHIDLDNLDTVLSFLNELTKIDPEAVENLIETRVKCNAELADHPTVQTSNNENGESVVGLLGIINGLFGVQPKNRRGYIAARFNNDGKLLDFIRIDDDQRMQLWG